MRSGYAKEKWGYIRSRHPETPHPSFVPHDNVASVWRVGGFSPSDSSGCGFVGRETHQQLAPAVGARVPPPQEALGASTTVEIPYRDMSERVRNTVSREIKKREKKNFPKKRKCTMRISEAIPQLVNHENKHISSRV